MSTFTAYNMLLDSKNIGFYDGNLRGFLVRQIAVIFVVFNFILKQIKVFYSIISFIAINVVNYFSRLKVAAKVLFSNKSVLKNIVLTGFIRMIRRANHIISMTISNARLASGGTERLILTFVRTIFRNSPLKKRGFGTISLPTFFTGSVWSNLAVKNSHAFFRTTICRPYFTRNKFKRNIADWANKRNSNFFSSHINKLANTTII